MAIGVGIIGYGRQGAVHAKRVANSPHYDLKAVCDPTDASREAARRDYPGVALYADASAMLEHPGIDLVIVVTPPQSHAALSIQCMRAGRHVVCEKPMCMNADEARAIRDASYETGRFFCVYQNRRRDLDFSKAKAVIDQGRIGRVTEMTYIQNGWGVGAMTWGTDRFRPQWRSERAYGGGMLYDWGAHLIDQALLLHDRPVASVFAQLATERVLEGQDAESGFRVLLTFDDGAHAHIEFQTTWPAPLSTQGWHLRGSKGGYAADTLYELAAGDDAKESQVIRTPVSDDVPRFNFWARFLEALEQGDRSLLPVPVEESLRVMQVIDAAFASHNRRCAVVFDPPV